MSSSRNASKGFKAGLLVLFVLITLAGAGFGGYTWWSRQDSTTTAGTEEEKQANIPVPIFMGIEPFTVNLPGVNNSRDRVLYIDMTLRLANERSREQLHEYLPEVRSRLLLLLSQQTSQILGTHDGKIQLMNAVKTTLAPTLVPGQPDQDISDVLFTTFILR